MGVGTPVEIDLTWNVPNGPGTSYTVPAGNQLTVDTVTGTCQGINAVVTGLAISGPLQKRPIFVTSLSAPDANPVGSTVTYTNVKVSYPTGFVLNLSSASSQVSGDPFSLVCFVSAYGRLIAAQ
jgi:hypothetical protein